MTERRERAARQVELGEALLEKAARSRAAETGETFEKAYAGVLRTPEGRLVHEALDEHSEDAKEPPGEPGGALAKAASAEAELAKMASARAAETGRPIAEAYAECLETDEGRRLYAEHCAALEEAG